MKDKVKVSVVQFESAQLQLEKNIERERAFVEAEAKQGSELIVFPEFSNIGFPLPLRPGFAPNFQGMTYDQIASQFVRAAEPIPGPTTEAISELTRRYGVYVVIGMVERHPVIPATAYNANCLIGPNGVIGVYHKVHLTLNEKQHFYNGNDIEVFKTELGIIGLATCYDIRFPELYRILALKGAEIVCQPWCIPAEVTEEKGITTGVECIKYRAYTRAQENGFYMVNSSAGGLWGSAQCLGHSAIAAPNGRIIAYSETSDEDVIRAELTEEELINYRAALNSLRDRRPELYGLICRPLSQPFKPPAATRPEAGAESDFAYPQAH